MGFVFILINPLAIVVGIDICDNGTATLAPTQALRGRSSPAVLLFSPEKDSSALVFLGLVFPMRGKDLHWQSYERDWLMARANSLQFAEAVQGT